MAFLVALYRLRSHRIGWEVGDLLKIAIAVMGWASFMLGVVALPIPELVQGFILLASLVVGGGLFLYMLIVGTYD